MRFTSKRSRAPGCMLYFGVGGGKSVLGRVGLDFAWCGSRCTRMGNFQTRRMQFTNVFSLCTSRHTRRFISLALCFLSEHPSSYVSSIILHIWGYNMCFGMFVTCASPPAIHVNFKSLTIPSLARYFYYFSSSSSLSSHMFSSAQRVPKDLWNLPSTRFTESNRAVAARAPPTYMRI